MPSQSVTSFGNWIVCGDVQVPSILSVANFRVSVWRYPSKREAPFVRSLRDCVRISIQNRYSLPWYMIGDAVRTGICTLIVVHGDHTAASPFFPGKGLSTAR